MENQIKRSRLPLWAIAARIGINRSTLQAWLREGGDRYEKSVDAAVTYLQEHPDWRKTYAQYKDDVIAGTHEGVSS